MRVSQTYASTVYERDSGLSARTMVIPRRSFLEPAVLDEPGGLIDKLEVQMIYEPRLGELTQIIAALVADMDLEKVDWTNPASLDAQVSNEQRAFAEYLLSAEIIPFEHSPLTGEVLGKLIGASAVSLGAGVVLLVAAGSSPLLLVAVPAGMLLFGAVSGVAKGLETGLAKRVSELIGGK